MGDKVARKVHVRELFRLQGVLVKLQEWVRAARLRWQGQHHQTGCPSI